MNVAFLGSGTFAVPILERLVDSGFRVVGVVTAPDRPSGRGLQPTPTPVKTAAQARSLHVFEPANVNSFEFIRELNALSPDVIVCADYGQILGRDLLMLPRYYCVNVHPSLLPRHRGPNPIREALLCGDEYTGVTVIRMTERVDSGPVLGMVREPIPPNATAGDMERILSGIGADLLVSVLRKIEQGTVTELPQDERDATQTRKLRAGDNRINWKFPAARVAAMIRAMQPKPGAYTHLGQERIKIFRARPIPLQNIPRLRPGLVVEAASDGIYVMCADGVVAIEELQAAGGRVMSAADYVNGNRIHIGDALS